MNRVDKENYYLDIAQSVLERSTCLRRKYGAIIVRNDEILSTGYNGAPRGRKNCVDLGRCTREELQVPSGQRYELCRSVHAEANAIISAARSDTLGATLYLSGRDAKTGQLLVNLHESTLSQKVAVVLDLEGLGVQQADLLNEEAVRIACTLCVRLLEAGIKVSAYSNGLDVHSGQPMALPEVSGPGSVLALRKAFACAQAANGLEPIEGFFPSGEGQRDENSLLCVLVTRDQRESLARAFAQRAGQREWLQIIPYRDEYEEMPQFGTVHRLYWEV